MKLARVSPWRELEEFEERVNRMMERAFRRPFLKPLFPGLLEEEELELGRWYPAIDVIDKEDSYVLKAELPGVKKEDVKVDVHDSTLTIKGEKKAEEKVEKENYLRIERSYGAFSRSFTLPENADAAKIKASYNDGVLELVIPKKEEAKPKTIQIEVK
jgi:HSP20 family protein